MLDSTSDDDIRDVVSDTFYKVSHTVKQRGTNLKIMCLNGL